MNKVDIYINGFRLDLFNDEEITINLSVQNVQDISKVFTDFTQTFTVPASAWNNAIFQHYYRSDVDTSTLTSKTLLNGESLFLDYKFRVLKDGGTVEAGSCCIDSIDALGGSYSETTTAVSFDGRLRQAARIEINSLPFRTGVIQIENVQLKGTEPYAYSITFYGDVVSLADLFGEDYLYDLDFSEYDFDYNDTNVYNGLTSNSFDPVFFPLMSPVKNWIYNSNVLNSDDTNIADNGSATPHGIQYYELKPAIKATAILDAIEAKYGITFTGSFLSSTPFVDLSLWLHRTEGYVYATPPTIAWQLIDFNQTTGGGTEFNLTTETWNVVDTDIYQLNVTVVNATADYEIGLFQNGEQVGSFVQDAHPAASVTNSFINLGFYTGDEVQLFIRPADPVGFTYRVDNYEAIDATTVTTRFQVDQTSTATYTFIMAITPLMPEIKVRDFLAGILKMYNMVIVPTTSTSFLLQPLEDWYASGTDQNYQTYFDITEYTVNRPPLYREIEFKYQDTDQILGYAYKRIYGVGYGDLRAYFTFDAETLNIEIPFECPLFELLTDKDTGSLTNALVYKSITSEANEDGTFNPYLGAGVLFYAYFDSYDLSANPIAFVDADRTTIRQVNSCWYANTSNRYSAPSAAYSIVFGSDLDPYFLQSIGKNLYNEYWEDYIVDLYDRQRRLIQVDAVLPLGAIIKFDPKNAVIWNNVKYIVNSVQLNMTTGKATFELLNVV